MVTVSLWDSSQFISFSFIQLNKHCITGELDDGSLITFDCKDVCFVGCGIISPPQPCGTLDCTWIEDPNNPIYDPPVTSAYYQTVRYSSDGFAPNGPFSYYKMWYDIASAGGIAVANSPDGINWTFDSNLTGLTGTARHSRILYDPAGFGIGAPYRIWYWDSPNPYMTDPIVLNMIRTATSLDGINWTNDMNISQSAANPLLVPIPTTDFNRGSYGPADILYYPANPAVLDLANPFNNRYVMYYDITDGATEQIALAVSVDGITWSKVGPFAVIPKGPPGSWDQNYVAEHAVVIQLGPNDFRAWYSGGVTSSSEGIGCATSTDGVNWTKFAGNPIFSINDGVAWRAGRTYNPWVLFDPQRFNGHGDSLCYKFWMTGGTSGSNLNIGYATNSGG
ncbi:hypothetical protein ACFFJY_02990 [Fictibacillus aquaticus]|uniref:hypothetical protein n=1 Tax=Fictibacillus aquaticus TaxID=2021314 RepID=UPI001055266B|nr:hypothetical protein [Fictibacillus aquaticus]